MDPKSQFESEIFRHPDARRVREPDIVIDEASESKSDRPERKPGKPKPPRRGWRTFKHFFWFLVVVILAAVLGYGIYLVTIIAKVSTNSWQLGPLAADASGRTNVLVLGVGDPGHAGENLSDTMMLVSLDKPGHRVAEVSLPRDLRVSIPGHGYSKINAANVYGGVPLAAQVVSNTLDVRIDYYVKTNFSGLRELVDAVGGIDVDVKERLADPEYPCDDNQYRACGLVIEPGRQHMDGTTALKYVRCRKGTCGNDFGRAARQQEVLSLLKPKLTDWHLALEPVRLQRVVTAVQHGIQTDMGLWQLLDFANTMRETEGHEPATLVLSTAKDGYLRGDPAGSSDLLPVSGDFSAIAERVKNIFAAP